MSGYGFNPFAGGYGQPPQMYAQQAAQQAYMQQMAQQPQMQQPQVITRMVTSRDEATTAQISFDPSVLNVFVNMAAGEVYIKRFNPNTGGSVFDDFLHASKIKQAQEEKPAPEYVTADRFDALESRVSELAETIAARRTRGAKTDE